MIARRHGDHNSFETVIHAHQPIGSSSERTGVLKIVATLAYLYQWIANDYMGWIETELSKVCKP